MLLVPLLPPGAIPCPSGYEYGSSEYIEGQRSVPTASLYPPAGLNDHMRHEVLCWGTSPAELAVCGPSRSWAWFYAWFPLAQCRNQASGAEVLKAASYTAWMSPVVGYLSTAEQAKRFPLPNAPWLLDIRRQCAHCMSDCYAAERLSEILVGSSSRYICSLPYRHPHHLPKLDAIRDFGRL